MGRNPDPDVDVTTNAGRCDVCGDPIDMRDADDTLTTIGFGVQDQKVAETYGITDQDAADAVADALERVGESGADYDLAETIRADHAITVHKSCLYDRTNYGMLESDPPFEPGVPEGSTDQDDKEDGR